MHVELTDDGILKITPATDFKGPETIEQAQENIRSLHEKVDDLDKIKGTLAHMPSHYINAEATRHYKLHARMVPTAMIADSFFKRMIGNFMLVLSDPGRPVRLFSDEAEALEWLHQAIAKHEKVKKS
tara:strand:- start:164 stop:544 length:381 start_codon:yes stop_codon:yes gene_type:complete